MDSSITKFKKLFTGRLKSPSEPSPAAEDQADPEVEFESTPSNTLCPITRRVFKAGEIVFQCWHCNLRISYPGGVFLKKNSKGRCCGCGGVNTLKRSRVPE